MKQIVYEKPKMKKVTLLNNRIIAEDNCWHLEANGTTDWWYYDYNKGEQGYLKFQLSDNCSGNEPIKNVEYLPENVGATPEALAAEEKLNSELKSIVKFKFLDYGITDDPGKVS